MLPPDRRHRVVLHFLNPVTYWHAVPELAPSAGRGGEWFNDGRHASAS